MVSSGARLGWSQAEPVMFGAGPQELAFRWGWAVRTTAQRGAGKHPVFREYSSTWAGPAC